MDSKPKLAIHKFSSCGGCQLALLHSGESLLALAELVEIVNFAEIGQTAPNERIDLALVEGSISTPQDIERIQQIREDSAYLISLGACATVGGLQALANFADRDEWMAQVYPRPDYIESLKAVSAISAHVKVDLELHGCPVNSDQVIRALRDLLSGVIPRRESDTLCMECKRKGVICTLVAAGVACMGPVTLAGCGALCPSLGRGCYGCYGPASLVNDRALASCFASLGLEPQASARHFHFITADAPVFRAAGEHLKTDTGE